MRFLTWTLAFATWLFVSSFVFSHTAVSATLTAASAVVAMVAALGAPGKPGLRFVMTLVALVLGFTALVLPDVSGAARLNNALVAPVLFVLSLVKPVHHHAPAAPHAT